MQRSGLRSLVRAHGRDFLLEKRVAFGLGAELGAAALLREERAEPGVRVVEGAALRSLTCARRLPVGHKRSERRLTRGDLVLDLAQLRVVLVAFATGAKTRGLEVLHDTLELGARADKVGELVLRVLAGGGEGFNVMLGLGDGFFEVLFFLFALVVFFAALVSTVHVGASVLLDLLESLTDLFELALVKGVLEAATVLVLVLELFELLLLLLELSETRFDVVEEFVDLGALRVGFGHDAQGL